MEQGLERCPRSRRWSCVATVAPSSQARISPNLASHPKVPISIRFFAQSNPRPSRSSALFMGRRLAAGWKLRYGLPLPYRCAICEAGRAGSQAWPAAGCRWNATFAARMVGVEAAATMCSLGEPVSATKALSMGLVDRASRVKTVLPKMPLPMRKSLLPSARGRPAICRCKGDVDAIIDQSQDGKCAQMERV